MLSPEETEALVETVGGMLATAALIMYSHSPMTHEHGHREIGGHGFCIHEYTAANGRIVRLYVDQNNGRALTMSIIVGDDEDVLAAPPIDFEKIHDEDVVNTLEHILALPDAEEPPHNELA